LPGSEEYVSLGQQLAQAQVDRGMIIGTITSAPAMTIISRRLGNVPEFKINAFEYYRTYPYRTDQWYYKE
jgi:peptide/nickel transport system substrate-binding protein